MSRPHLSCAVSILLAVLSIACASAPPPAIFADEPPPPADTAVPESAATAADAAVAADAPQEAAAATPPIEKPKPWRPPAPAPTSKDWLRLKSGEWLRGDLELMRDDKVSFDSKELDDLSIDWDDISEIRSPRLHTYRFVGRIIHTGTVRMKDGIIRLDTGTEVVEFKKNELVTMIEGEPKEINFWSAKLSIGLTARSGNTESADFSASVRIVRQTALNRFQTEYDGTFASVDGDENTNNHRLRSVFDMFVTKSLYVTIPTVELFKDKFQNLDLRATPGVGVGYEIIDKSWVDWSVGSSIGYQYTKYLSVEEGEESSEHDAALTFMTELDFDPKYFEWENEYRLQVVVTDLDKTNHHFSSVFSVDIWGPLDLELSLTFDRIESPRATAIGTTPESNDFQLTAGIGLDL